MTLRDASGWQLAVRRGKVALLGAARLARWGIEGWPRPALAARRGSQVLWRRAVPIARPHGDPRLEAGKHRNLALAAPAFDGLEVSAARPLSFWRVLGPVRVGGGYAAGMEVRGGCVVPSIGGGLCLLSNALFAMAAELGWCVLERHGHSVALADRRALDATVAWPHIDLRIAPREGAATIQVQIRDGALVIAVHGDRASALDVSLTVIEDTLRPADDGGEPWLDLVIRRRVARGGELIEDAVLVDDRKRVRSDTAPVRTCLDCAETACRARVTIPAPTPLPRLRREVAT